MREKMTKCQSCKKAPITVKKWSMCGACYQKARKEGRIDTSVKEKVYPSSFRSSVKKEKAINRRNEVMSLLEKGLTYEAVGAKLGVTSQRVYQIAKTRISQPEDMSPRARIEETAKRAATELAKLSMLLDAYADGESFSDGTTVEYPFSGASNLRGESERLLGLIEETLDIAPKVNP